MLSNLADTMTVLLVYDVLATKVLIWVSSKASLLKHKLVKLSRTWLHGPCVSNSGENGVSPLISVDEAQDIGFRCVIFLFASLAPAYTAIKYNFEWLNEFCVTGSKIGPKTIFEVCRLRDLMVIDEQAGGDAFKKGV